MRASHRALANPAPADLLMSIFFSPIVYATYVCDAKAGFRSERARAKRRINYNADFGRWKKIADLDRRMHLAKMVARSLPRARKVQTSPARVRCGTCENSAAFAYLFINMCLMCEWLSDALSVNYLPLWVCVVCTSVDALFVFDLETFVCYVFRARQSNTNRNMNSDICWLCANQLLTSDMGWIFN